MLRARTIGQVIGFVLCLLVVPLGQQARALSPSPNVTAVEYNYLATTSTVPSTVHEVIVEGGPVTATGTQSGACTGATVAHVESATKYWLDAGRAVATELTMLPSCGSVSQLITLMSDIANYLKPDPNFTRLWNGFFLDEESGYGFSATDITALNDGCWNNVISLIPGASNCFGQIFLSTGAAGWTSTNFARSLQNVTPAPQVYTSNMVTVVNRANFPVNDVTWTSVPGASESCCNLRSTADGSITSAPYQNDFSTANIWYWDNQWQNA